MQPTIWTLWGETGKFLARVELGRGSRNVLKS
jgi:hypothetical protein